MVATLISAVPSATKQGIKLLSLSEYSLETTRGGGAQKKMQNYWDLLLVVARDVQLQNERQNMKWYF